MPLVVFLFIAGIGCVGTAVGVIGMNTQREIHDYPQTAFFVDGALIKRVA